MTGLEVEHLARAAQIAKATAEDKVRANAVRPYQTLCKGFLIKIKTNTPVGANCVRPHLQKLIYLNTTKKGVLYVKTPLFFCSFISPIRPLFSFNS